VTLRQSERGRGHSLAQSAKACNADFSRPSLHLHQCRSKTLQQKRKCLTGLCGCVSNFRFERLAFPATNHSLGLHRYPCRNPRPAAGAKRQDDMATVKFSDRNVRRWIMRFVSWSRNFSWRAACDRRRHARDRNLSALTKSFRNLARSRRRACHRCDVGVLATLRTASSAVAFAFALPPSLTDAKDRDVQVAKRRSGHTVDSRSSRLALPVR